MAGKTNTSTRKVPATRQVKAAPVAAKTSKGPAVAKSSVLPPVRKKRAAPKPRAAAQPTPPQAAAPIKGVADMATASFAPEKFQSFFTDFSDRAKATLEKSAQLSEELAELTKGNFEAASESAKIAAKGAETIAQGTADFTKKSFEDATAAMKRYTSIKSPAELMQLNSELVKSSFDSAVAHASMMSEAMTKLAGEIFQPLSSRYAVAAEKIKAAAL